MGLLPFFDVEDPGQVEESAGGCLFGELVDEETTGPAEEFEEAVEDGDEGDHGQECDDP